MPEISDPSPPAPENGPAPPGADKLRLKADNPRVWLALGGGALALVLVAVVSVLWGLPISRSMEPMESPTLVLVSADGKPFARRGSYKDEPVDVATLPRHVYLAFVAIEDRRFYNHGGVDLRAIGRAVMTNAKQGETVQGGSTITQQLAKNAFTGDEQTLRRKAREAVIAMYLEARLSKQEILSRYLSSVYFGEGVFGLRGAAKHYFAKEPEALSVGEAAMLAGMIKAPSKLSPNKDRKAADARQRLVLAAMTQIGVISRKEAKAAQTVKLHKGRPALPVGSWFADWVSAGAKDGFDRAYGEVRVQTTLESDLQTQAERILTRTLTANGKRMRAGEGALVAMRTDGRVVAMVGGQNYKASQFNRAVQAERQPGSAFKLFVYLAALRQGMTPDSLVLDAPVKVGGWSPQNYEGKYAGGMIPLRQAFAKSSNAAAVRLSQQTGRGGIVHAARDLGLTGALPDDATLALGTASVTLLELTSAYAAIAAGEAPVQAYGVATARPTGPRKRLAAFEQDNALTLLRATVTSGTATGAALPIAAYGKTGTTQDYRDAWFIGFAGDLVVGVWIGNDDNTPMKGVTGGSLPAGVWREFMSYALSRGDIGPAPFAPSIPVTVAALEDAPFLEDENFGESGLEVFGGRAEAAEFDDRALPPERPMRREEEFDAPFPDRRPPPRRTERFEDEEEDFPPPPVLRRREPPPEPIPPPRIRREFIPPERPIDVPDEDGFVG